MDEIRDYLDAYVVVLELEGGNDFLIDHRNGSIYMKKPGFFSIKISGYERNQVKLDITFNKNSNWRLYRVLEKYQRESKDSYIDIVKNNDAYFYSVFENQQSFLKFFMKNIVGDSKAGI